MDLRALIFDVFGTCVDWRTSVAREVAAVLRGVDSLLSIVQMPAGVPVGSLAIGGSGAANAALLAAQMLGAGHPEIREAVREYRAARTRAVLADPDPRVPAP